MTKFRIEWEYDPADQTAHRLELDTDTGRFFAAWVNLGTGAIEWTSTDHEYPGGPHFEELVRLMEESEDRPQEKPKIPGMDYPRHFTGDNG